MNRLAAFVVAALAVGLGLGLGSNVTGAVLAVYATVIAVGVGMLVARSRGTGR